MINKRNKLRYNRMYRNYEKIILNAGLQREPNRGKKGPKWGIYGTRKWNINEE